MKISLDNLDHDDGMVTVYCDDKQAAIDDQSIDGSLWEAPGDLDVAYAVILDRPGLITELRADGYEVNIQNYVEPDGH
jgi:hypothetical protein